MSQGRSLYLFTSSISGDTDLGTELAIHLDGERHSIGYQVLFVPDWPTIALDTGAATKLIPQFISHMWRKWRDKGDKTLENKLPGTMIGKAIFLEQI